MTRTHVHRHYGAPTHMPLADPFRIRIDTIRIFLELPPIRLLALRSPPDLSLVARKLLKALDEQPDSPHLFVSVDVGFADYGSFFRGIVAEVAEQVRAAAGDLAAVGVRVPSPPDLPPSPVEGPDDARDLVRKTANYLSNMAESLGDDVGSVCFVLSPADDSPRRAFRWSLTALAEEVTSDWCKFLVLDDKPRQIMDGVQAECSRAIEVDFAVPPEEIREELEHDLASNELPEADRRRHLLLAGAMEASSRRPERARKLLKEAAESARLVEASGEEANAYFNLGNVELNSGQFEKASEHFVRAARLATEEGLNPLAAMALTNLGVSLHRETRSEEAAEAFGAAWKLFDALDFRPGKAHVLDCTAQAYRLGGDIASARKLWRQAGEIYASIDAPHLASTRETGQVQIRSRLADLGPDAGRL